MSILPTETLASIRTAVARASGALEFSGTVTTYTDTTHVTDTGLSAYVSADRLKGLELVPKGGTGAATAGARLITASTVAGALTLQKALSAALSTDTTYDIYRPGVADKALLDLAIKFAIEQAQDTHLIDWEDVASVVLGSVTKNGGFEDWTSGTSVAPDGWTLEEGASPGAAIARESTLILPPYRYAAKLTNEASQYAALQQQNAALMYPWDALGDDSVKLSAVVYCTTASRARLRLYDGTTTTNSTYHGGTGWEKLTISATSIAASPSELSASLRIETGAAISAYAHDFRIVPSSTSIHEFYLPKKFLRLASIWSEGGTDYQWDALWPQGVWSIDRSRERIVFDARLWTPPGEYLCRLVGQSYQAVPAADTDSIDLPVAYLIAAARSFLVAMGHGSDDMRAQAGQIHGEALRLRRQLHRQPLASSIRCR